MYSTKEREPDDGTMCRYAEHIGSTLGAIVEAMADEARRTAFCLSTDPTGTCIQPAPDDREGTRRPCNRRHFFVVLAAEQRASKRSQIHRPLCEHAAILAAPPPGAPRCLFTDAVVDDAERAP